MSTEDNNKESIFSFSITDENRKDLKEASDRSKIPQKEILNRLIREFFDDMKTDKQ